MLLSFILEAIYNKIVTKSNKIQIYIGAHRSYKLYIVFHQILYFNSNVPRFHQKNSYFNLRRVFASQKQLHLVRLKTHYNFDLSRQNSLSGIWCIFAPVYYISILRIHYNLEPNSQINVKYLYIVVQYVFFKSKQVILLNLIHNIAETRTFNWRQRRDDPWTSNLFLNRKSSYLSLIHTTIFYHIIISLALFLGIISHHYFNNGQREWWSFKKAAINFHPELNQH